MTRWHWTRTVLATLWKMGAFWRRPHRAVATLYLLATHLWRWRTVGPALDAEIECGVRMLREGRTDEEIHDWLMRRHA